MNIEEFREFCLSLPGVVEDLPFGPNTLVMKVGGKMFAAADIAAFESINVKCHPETAVELRERYQSVLPGYHMNKKHWNTLLVEGELGDAQLQHWIRHSYDLVAASLPKAKSGPGKSSNE